MSAGRGFQLDEPQLSIPWGIRQVELQTLLRGQGGLRFVTQGYHVVPCKALGGLQTMLGFHFRPPAERGILTELEFFDNGAGNLGASFALYQQHLELTFGRPSGTAAGSYSADMPSYEWRRGRIRVSHFVMERFGPEEHVRVLRKGLLTSWLT